MVVNHSLVLKGFNDGISHLGLLGFWILSIELYCEQNGIFEN